MFIGPMTKDEYDARHGYPGFWGEDVDPSDDGDPYEIRAELLDAALYQRVSEALATREVPDRLVEALLAD
jgi:hypothetical protein